MIWARFLPEVTGITFSDSDYTPVPKFFNLGPDPRSKIFQIWESDSCSDSGCIRCTRNLPMFLLKKWQRSLLLLLKLKSGSGSGSGFQQIVDSGPGSERKMRNPAGVESGTPDPWPHLVPAQTFLSLTAASMINVFFQENRPLTDFVCFQTKKCL